MSKIEKQIKKYYLDSFKHASQLNNIKSRANFTDEPRFNFSKILKLGMGLSLSAASILGAIIITSSINESENHIAPMTQRIEKAVVQINTSPTVLFTVDDKGIVDSIYGKDDDGKLLVYGMDVLNQSYEEVIKKIIDEEVACGYLLKDEKNKKYNNLSFTIYDDNSNIDANEFALTIQNYLTKKSVVLNEEVEVEVEEDFDKVYPYEGKDFDSFDSFYEELKEYYLAQGDAVSEIVEEFDAIVYYYSSRLAYYETLFLENEIVDEIIDVLAVRINNYIEGYYNLFIGENSSYQEQYKVLMDEKMNLLINRTEEDFNYDAEIKKIDKKISSLETLKAFFMDSGLKPKLEKINKELSLINEYLTNFNFDEMDCEDFSKKVISKTSKKNKEFNDIFDKTSLIETFLNFKEDLKNHFR